MSYYDGADGEAVCAFCGAVDPPEPHDCDHRLSGVECAVVAAVADLTAEYGYPPILREIAAAIGWASTGSAHWYVRRLVDAGVLYHEPHRPRSLRLAPGIVTSRNGQVARVVWPEPIEVRLDPTGCPICRGDAS